jgi:hypothetical protein
MKRFLLALLATTSFAHAAYYVECGTELNEDFGTFETVSFRASSEDEIFSGLNSDVWSVALDDDWLTDGKATAKVIQLDRSKNLEIIVAKGTGLSRIGKRFVVVDMYADFPVLEVYNVGGFAGGVKTNQYDCYTAQM